MEKINVDWNKYALQYDAITTKGTNPAYMELVNKVQNHFKDFGLSDNSLLVDLGGGTGNFSIPLAKRYTKNQFVIVDDSEQMLEIAESKIKREGLENISTLKTDCENIERVVNDYDKPINHCIMIHALYATRTKEDPEKPQRILNNLYQYMEDDNNSTFMLSDINRQLRTGSWVAYSIWNGLKTFKSLKKTIDYFKEHDEAKKANEFIDQMQKEGHFLICELDELEKMVKDAGFSKIYEKSDKYYRGRDNLLIAGK